LIAPRCRHRRSRVRENERERERERANIATREAVRCPSRYLFLFSPSLSLGSREIRLGRRPRSFDRAKIDPEVRFVNCISEPWHRSRKRKFQIAFLSDRFLLMLLNN